MNKIETLIEPYRKFGVVWWTLSNNTLSLFVTNVNVARLNLPKTIDGHNIVIYQSS